MFPFYPGQLINTNNNQNGSSLLPKVTPHVQLANSGMQQVRPVVNPGPMVPGQISLAAGGMGLRPGVTMTSMIRPTGTLQFQTINSGGQTKVKLLMWDKFSHEHDIGHCSRQIQ